MNAAQRAHSAYGDAAAKSPRQIEYQAFARITQSLTGASKPKAEPEAEDFPRLAAALHDNLRLWTLVAGEVASAQNGLPKALRAQLFYLAEFTRSHTGKVLKGEAEADALVEINTAVMRGLREQADAA